jgi:hypothetical protein
MPRFFYWFFLVLGFDYLLLYQLLALQISE